MATCNDIQNTVYHTHLYSDKAFKILNMFINIMKWKSDFTAVPKKVYNTFKAFELFREPDNEITIKFMRENKNSTYYYRYNDFIKTYFYSRHSDFLVWFSWYFKNFIKTELENMCSKNIVLNEAEKNNDVKWKRSNTTKFKIIDNKPNFVELNTINIEKCSILTSISEIYLIYDVMLGRVKQISKYTKEQKDEIIGLPADPFTTEIERARREEIETLKNKIIVEKNRLDTEFNKKIQIYREACLKECSELKTEIENKILSEINTLNEAVGVKF